MIAKIIAERKPPFVFTADARGLLRSFVAADHIQQNRAVLISPQPLHVAFGGADRDRTDDPLLAKQVLSQLSYSPIGSARD